MRSCGRAVVRPCVRQSRTPNFVSGRYGCSGQFSEGGRSNLALKSGAQIWRSNLALKSGAQIWRSNLALKSGWSLPDAVTGLGGRAGNALVLFGLCVRCPSGTCSRTAVFISFTTRRGSSTTAFQS